MGLDKIRSRLPLLVHAALALSVFLLHVHWVPYRESLSDDAGVFAYAGSRILRGDVPYVDFWDHKPPLVFYVYALGFKLFGESVWSIWLLSLLSNELALGVLLASLRKVGPPLAGLWITLLCAMTILHPTFGSGENFADTYALLPQSLIIYGFLQYLNSGRSRWVILMGACTGLALLLKHTTVSLGFAACLLVGAALVWQRTPRRAVAMVAALAIAMIAVVTIMMGYLAVVGDSREMWKALINFNLLYVGGSLGLRSYYGALRSFALKQPLLTLFVLAIAVFPVAIVTLLAAARKRLAWDGGGMWKVPPPSLSIAQVSWLGIALGMVALPLEVFMVGSVGRSVGSGYYYLPALPSLALCGMGTLTHLGAIPQASGVSMGRSRGGWILIAALLGTVGLTEIGKVRPSGDDFRQLATHAFRMDLPADELVSYVRSHTRPGDTIQVWWRGSPVYFLSGRRPASRYLYAAPLLMPGFENARRFREFLEDLERERPALIITPSRTQGGIPYFDQDDEHLRKDCSGCSRATLEGLAALREFVSANYTQALETQDRMLVYRLRLPDGAGPGKWIAMGEAWHLALPPRANPSWDADPAR